MTGAVHLSGGTKGLSVGKKRFTGGLKELVAGYKRTSSGLEQIYQSLSADGSGPAGISVSPTQVGGVVNSASSQTVTTKEATVTVTGGVSPYSYLWSNVSGDALDMTDSTGASCAFSGAVAPGNELQGVFKCTVTDAAGTSQDSPGVTAILNNIGGTL